MKRLIIYLPIVTFYLNLTNGNVCNSTIYANPCTCSKTAAPDYLPQVNCSGKGLTEIPGPDIQNNVGILILKDNKITTLKNENFYSKFYIVTLDLQNNLISDIEDRSLDRLFSLRVLILKNNKLTVIRRSMIEHLTFLKLIDLSYNNIERIDPDSFLSLPSIGQISMGANKLMCDCQTIMFKEWLAARSGAVTVVDFMCSNLGNKTLDNVVNQDFGGCTGQSVFKTDSCRTCSGVKGQQDCTTETACPIGNKNACFGRVEYGGNSGLRITRGCDTYNNCLQYAQSVNPNQCYERQGDTVLCQFCCVGNNCNNYNMGLRTKTENVDLNVTLVGELGSSDYTSFMKTIENELAAYLNEDKSIASYFVHVSSISPPMLTVRLNIECETFKETKEKYIHDYFNTKMNLRTTLTSRDILSYAFSFQLVCPEVEVVTTKGKLVWPAAQLGASVAVKCPVSDINDPGYALRQCLGDNSQAMWGPIDDSRCQDAKTVTEELDDLAGTTITENNADDVIQKLVDVSSLHQSYSAKDVNTTVAILESVIDSTVTSVQRATNMVKIASNVLETQVSLLETSENNDKSSSRLLQAVDAFSAKMTLTSDFKAVEPNLAVLAVPSTSSSFDGLTLSTKATPSVNLTSSQITLADGNQQDPQKSSFYLPKTIVDSLSSSQKGQINRITFAVYPDGKLFQSISDKQSTTTKSVVSDEEKVAKNVNSLVIAASIPGVTVVGLTDPIVLHFRHKSENAANPSCVFWNVGTSNADPYWSDNGCVAVRTESEGEANYTTCQCNHLTNFALLMDVYGTGGTLSEGNKRALSIISYIGCAISLGGLLLTIVTMLAFRKLRGSNPSKILINLCIALGATNLVFLAGQQKYTLESMVGCKIVAVIMHYFLLASMTWMAVEAYSMYLALVKVFHSHVSRFMLKAMVVGWGIPIVAVAITLGVNKTENYGYQAGDICWLRSIAFYCAFLAPVGLMLILNIIAFVLVSRQLLGMTGPKIKKSSEAAAYSSRLRRIISVMILLGLTWILAVFAVQGTGGVIVQYLFTIFNSLQGLFIFIFYCLLNTEAQKAWKSCLPCFESDEKSTAASKEVSSSNDNKSSSTSGTTDTGATTFENGTYDKLVYTGSLEDRRSRYQGSQFIRASNASYYS